MNNQDEAARASVYIGLTPTQDLIRTSFHHLIGDLWLNAMVNKRLNLRDLKANPLIYMLDGDVPLPNAKTMLAWILTCESGACMEIGDQVSATYTFAMPESVSSRYYTANDCGVDGRVRESIHLPAMANFRGAIGQRMREAIATCGCDHLPTVVRVTNGTAKHTKFMMHYDLDYSESEAKTLIYERDYLMKAVVSRPRIALDAYRSTLCTGLHIRPWTQHGLAVRAVVDHMRWTQNKESVLIVPGTSGVVSPYVPRISPHVWFGFGREMFVQGKGGIVPSARVRWADAYVSLRDEALRLLKEVRIRQCVPDEFYQPNPAWRDQLAEAGLIQTAKAPKRSEIAQRAISSIQDLFNQPVKPKEKDQ